MAYDFLITIVSYWFLVDRIGQRNDFHFGKWKYGEGRLWNGDIDSTSMYCVEVELFFAKLSKEEVFWTNKHLRLFNLQLVYLFCQNFLAKGGSVIKLIWNQADKKKFRVSSFFLTFFIFISSTSDWTPC